MNSDNKYRKYKENVGKKNDKNRLKQNKAYSENEAKLKPGLQFVNNYPDTGAGSQPSSATTTIRSGHSTSNLFVQLTYRGEV